MVQSLGLGDLTGFAALAFVGASALIMVLRARLIKIIGVDLLRNIHVAVSVVAALFLSAHIALLFTPPITIAVDLGYGAFILGIVLWATGVGFLERNKDSFFLHGSLAVAVVALVVVHAASNGANFPSILAVPALVGSGVVVLASATYNLRRLLSKPR